MLVGSLHLPLESSRREVLGKHSGPMHAITWHCHLGDKQQLEVSRTVGGGVLGKRPSEL